MKMLKLFKRWINMLTGKSVFHVKQGIGKFYSKTEVKGYYNDLTGKVSDKTKLDNSGIPITTTITGLRAYFPIAIFQYGLGLYDLYLETQNEKILENFMRIADWALNTMTTDGMWDCMGTLNDSKHLTQSAMAQSQGVSILIRAYIQSNQRKYLKKATLALKFMLKDTKNGGTCLYKNNEIIFQEYVSQDNLSVLNGWIFSVFGLYDYVIFTQSKEYENLLNTTIKSLVNNLKKYDRGYWSNYDQKGTISSPAYHDIHIMQLELLYDLFKEQTFQEYSIKWKKYQNNKFYKYLAMAIKLKQKLLKSKYYDINTSTIE